MGVVTLDGGHSLGQSTNEATPFEARSPRLSERATLRVPPCACQPARANLRVPTCACHPERATLSVPP